MTSTTWPRGAVAQLGAARPTISLADLYGPIAEGLDRAEEVFAEELKSRLPFVQELVDHGSGFRGKRLRPALVLLTGEACGGTTPAHPVLAAVVEMVHTATLVHDDILDESMVRRHAATVNAEWGNETAVLLGDYLFTHAFHLAASLESALACRWIGRATNLVCEGEMAQVHHRGDLELDEPSYLEFVRGKTAELTAVACKLGAHYAGAAPDVVERAETYGRELGVAFQVVDDVLDLWGEERATGKTLGTDLLKQKLTLPLIRHLRTLGPQEARDLRRWLSEPTPGLRGHLREAMERSGALAQSWKFAEATIGRATRALDVLEASPARDGLVRLAELAVRRRS